jgi:phosphoglycolate phosphatase
MCEAGAEPENTIVVGDTVYDIAMARAAGATGVGVTWGYHPGAALKEAGALAVIDRFANLVPTLDSIWAT